MIEKDKIKRGNVFIADLNPTIGSEQYGRRPVVILSNDLNNKYSPTILVAPLTKIIKKVKLPTHIPVNKNEFLKNDSMILVEQIRAIDKKRLKVYLGHLKSEQIKLVDKAIINAVDLKVKWEEKL